LKTNREKKTGQVGRMGKRLGAENHGKEGRLVGKICTKGYGKTKKRSRGGLTLQNSSRGRSNGEKNNGAGGELVGVRGHVDCPNPDPT